MSATYSVPTDKGKISVKLLENKKQQYAQVLIQFTSSESELLNALLERFIREKSLTVGTSVSTKMANLTTRGLSSIYYTVPDSKLLSSITVIYAFMMKSKIKASEVKTLLHKKASYKKLHSDLRSFSVFITGKCIATARKFASKDKAIMRFENVIKATPVNVKIEAKDIMMGKTLPPPCEEVVEETQHLTPFQRLLLAVLMSDNYFHFNSSGKIVLCPNEKEWFAMQLKLYKDILNAKYKAFIQQGGSLGSKPSKNDSNGEKLKLRNSNAVAVARFNVEMMNHLFGVDMKLTDINESSFATLKSDNISAVATALTVPKAKK